MCAVCHLRERCHGPGRGTRHSSIVLGVSSGGSPPELVSFSLKSTLDILPTNKNLCMLGKKSYNTCSLHILSHVLKNCPTAIEQRYDLWLLELTISVEPQMEDAPQLKQRKYQDLVEASVAVAVGFNTE